MKNLKKVLALVLAFACAFTMFAGAVVYPDVPAGSEFSEAITFLSDLGIIQGKDDGKYHSEDSITRAEACALIARMLTGDPDVSQFAGASNFTDVAKGSWKESAIGYCVVNGITVGVGNGKFEPDRAITDAEFVTMVVRAMGYETTGTTYPYGHISAAQANGLLDGVSVVPTSAALRGEDAQIMFNAMFADYARGAKMVNTTHGTTVEEYDTIAHAVWGLERAAVGEYGKDKDSDNSYYLKNCKAHTWVIVGESYTSEDAILAYPIDDDSTDMFVLDSKKHGPYEFKYDGDIETVKGYQVELYGEGDHGEPVWDKEEENYTYSKDWTIKAIKTVKGQTSYDYNASMADSKSDNGEIVLGETTLDLESVADNSKDVLASTVAPIDLFIGGKHNTITATTDKKVEEALNVRDADQYKLMDWDSDGDVDWIVVDEAKVYKVENATSKRVAVTSMEAAGANWQVSKDENGVTWNIDGMETGSDKYYDFNGFKSDKDYKVAYNVPEDLEEGAILEVTASFAYDKGEKAPVVTFTANEIEMEAAELSKVSTKGDLELTFDGDVKKVAENKNNGDVIVPENPEIYEDFDDEELGTSFGLYLNRNGFIVYSKYAEDDGAGYLMVLDTTDGQNTLPRKNARIDAMLGDGTYKTEMEVAADLKLDQDFKGTDAYEQDEVKGVHSGRHFNEHQVVGHVYKYYTNADGVITKMKPVAGTEFADAYEYDAKKDRVSVGTSTVGSLDEAKVIFAVTKDYIRYDSKTNIDDEEQGLYVDKDDVLAVNYKDIPDIVDRAAGDDQANSETLDNRAHAEQDGSTYYGYTSWIDAAVSTTQKNARMAYDIDDNKAITAAVLGVDNFDEFNNAAVKVGLITAVSASTSNKNVTVDLAYDGKVEEDVAAVDGKKVSDIFEKASDGSSLKDVSAVKAMLTKYGNKAGAYAEVSFNDDGKITKVVFMDSFDNTTIGNNREVLKGNSYKVERVVVGENKKSDSYIDFITGAYFYNDKNFYSLDRLDDINEVSLDLDKDAKYYTFSEKPSFGKDMKNEILSITNGFVDKYTVEAGERADLTGSNINNKFDDMDTYVTADIITKLAETGDVVAAFVFDDMGEKAAKNAATGLSLKDFKAGESTSANIDPVAGQSATATIAKQPYAANDSTKTPADGLMASLAARATTVSLPATLTITADRTVAAGKYCVDVTVTTAGQATGETTTLTFEVLPADAQVASTVSILGVTADTIEVQVLDENGKPVVGLDETAFTIEVDRKVLQNTDKNEDFSVVEKDGKYQLTIRDDAKVDTLMGKKIKVTVGGKTAEESTTTPSVDAGDVVEEPTEAVPPVAQDVVDAINTAVTDLGLTELPKKLDEIDNAKQTAVAEAIVKTEGFVEFSKMWTKPITNPDSASEQDKKDAADQYLKFMANGFIPKVVDLNDVLFKNVTPTTGKKYVLVQKNAALNNEYWETVPSRNEGVKISPAMDWDARVAAKDLNFVITNTVETVTFELYEVESSVDTSTMTSLSDLTGTLVGSITLNF